MSGTFDPRGATFVGAPRWPVSEPGDPAAYFRTEFNVDPGLIGATLAVTALGLVEPYVNGQRVGDAVLEPGWTSYRHRLLVRSYDVTDDLRTGANALGAIVAEGWALGRLGYPAIARRRIFAERVALLMVLELRYADRVEHVTSSNQFRAGEGRVRGNSIYDGITIDNRLEPCGWTEPGFNDDGWDLAETVPWDLATLVPAAVPPVRRIEALAPVDIWTTDRQTTVVDFGQNLVGWVRLRVGGTAGREITVRHAEVLEGGVPSYETLRTAQATDRFILAGHELEEFEPTFTFHGFRYAELDGLPEPLEPGDLEAVVVHSDMRRTGWFETSNELVNRLHENVVWSMRGNFVGLPTDCPQRDERLGWTGDINAFGPTAAYLYDVRDVLGSWLADVRHEQAEHGYVPYVVPDVHSHADAPTALWSDCVISLPWALYQAYGDVDILRDSYDSMVAFIDSVEARLDADGLWSSGFQFGDWLDPDAPRHNPVRGKTDRYLVASAFLHKDVRELAATAEVLGQDADRDRYHALADRVRAAFRDEYVSPKGRLVNETATAYALSIQFGLLDPEQLAKAGARLCALVRAAGHRISTGFAGTPVVAHALTTVGRIDDAYKLLLQTKVPSFLYPVTQGATSVWERWDAVLPDGRVNATGMTSLNHYALGAVADWLHTTVGGLRATSPGYRTMRIAPHPGPGLDHARAVLDTVHGRVAAQWRRSGSELTLEVTVPEGIAAEVHLPLHPDGDVHSIAGERRAWTYQVDDPASRLTLESTLDELAGDDSVWRAVREILGQQIPHVPADVLRRWCAGQPLRTFLDELPGITDGAAAELATAIASEQPSGN